jgi:methylated-DNA-[protein]-cysteine S-methyltransferase
MTDITRARTLDSPIGPITLAGDDDALTRLVMHEQRHAPGDLAYWPQDPNAFGDVVDQLKAYWEGDLKEFDVPLGF